MRILTLSLLAIILSVSLSAQPWLENLPKGKSSEELTLFDYQQAFESYWAPFNLERGTYLKNGVTTKAPGWKQFKRWEYQMQSVVNPTTGAFPEKQLIRSWQHLSAPIQEPRSPLALTGNRLDQIVPSVDTQVSADSTPWLSIPPITIHFG